MMFVVAHAGGAPEFASTALIASGLVVGWIGLSRLRGRGFGRLPRAGGFVLVVLAPVAIVGAVVVPALVWPDAPAGRARPASSARIAFGEPSPGQVVTDADLAVSVRLEDASLVDGTSANLAPDTGHLHLFLDGVLLSMTSAGEQIVDVGQLEPGPHRLQAEFVAADHAPFDPRVVTAVTFVKGGP